MKKSSWIVLAAVVALAAVLGYNKLFAPPLSDREQIRALLASGEAAIEGRNMSAAMACVSKGYEDESGLNRDALRLQVIEAFRNIDGYDLTVTTEEMRIDGKEAQARILVILAAVEDGERHEVFSGPITVRLREEPSRRYLVLPSKAWRVTGMTGLPLSGDGL